MTGAESGVDLSVIVVSWNTAAITERCLRTLRSDARGIATEIVVVDNASTDGSAAMIRTTFPDVKLIVNSSNEGFTRANNAGLAVASGRYTLLLNSDAYVKEGCVSRLIHELESRPRAAAVGPRLEYGDGRWQRWTAGSAPSLRTAVNHYLFLEHFLPGRPVFPGLYLSADVRLPRAVDWVSGACMLLRTDAVRTVGGLDERLFLYMDDVDLCQRLRDIGWEIWYCPEAEATHLMGQTIRGRSDAPPLAALRSFDRYFGERHGRGALLALRAVQIIGFSLRAAIYRSASLVWRRPALAQQAKAHLASLLVILRAGLGTR